MLRGVAKDIDTTTDSGYYDVTNESTTNIPDGFFKYGILEVETLYNYKIQKYYPIFKGVDEKYGLAIRFYNLEQWTEWKYIPYNN